jgi:hypothetical protein
MRVASFLDLLFSSFQVNTFLPKFTISPPRRFIKTLKEIWTGIDAIVMIEMIELKMEIDGAGKAANTRLRPDLSVSSVK